jgi:hypothetical protein
VHDLYLQVSGEALQRAFRAARALDVEAGGVYDCGGAAINIWTHPWRGPRGNKAASRLAATIGVSWDPPMILFVHYRPSLLRWPDVRNHFNFLAGETAWRPGFRQRAFIAARTRNPYAHLGIREWVSEELNEAEENDRFPLKRLDARTWADLGIGDTQASIWAARCVRRHGLLGAIRSLVVRRRTPNHPYPSRYNAEVTGSRGRLLLSGLNCGYGGQGSGGTLAVARMLGFIPPLPPGPLLDQYYDRIRSQDVVEWVAPEIAR